VSTLILQQLDDAASDLHELSLRICARVDAGTLSPRTRDKVNRVHDDLERHQWLFDLTDPRGHFDRLNVAVGSYRKAYNELHNLLHKQREPRHDDT
jgi:hypothetical protein